MLLTATTLAQTVLLLDCIRPRSHYRDSRVPVETRWNIPHCVCVCYYAHSSRFKERYCQKNVLLDTEKEFNIVNKYSVRLTRMKKFITKQIAAMFELRKYRYMFQLPSITILRERQYSKTYTEVLCDLPIGNGKIYKIKINLNIVLNNNVYC